MDPTRRTLGDRPNASKPGRMSSHRKTLLLGTRGSPLAVAQSTQVADMLRAGGVAVELRVIRHDRRPHPGSTAGRGRRQGALHEGTGAGAARRRCRLRRAQLQGRAGDDAVGRRVRADHRGRARPRRRAGRTRGERGRATRWIRLAPRAPAPRARRHREPAAAVPTAGDPPRPGRGRHPREHRHAAAEVAVRRGGRRRPRRGWAPAGGTVRFGEHGAVRHRRHGPVGRAGSARAAVSGRRPFDLASAGPGWTTSRPGGPSTPSARWSCC